MLKQWLHLGNRGSRGSLGLDHVMPRPEPTHTHKPKWQSAGVLDGSSGTNGLRSKLSPRDEALQALPLSAMGMMANTSGVLVENSGAGGGGGGNTRRPSNTKAGTSGTTERPEGRPTDDPTPRIMQNLGSGSAQPSQGRRYMDISAGRLLRHATPTRHPRQRGLSKQTCEARLSR